ncbi:YaaC family protein [Limibacillus halophilus]|uniref:YaaC-like Protein n=1 Tax=Limibacillus halophilus TaxID=1579333 RepID=A0A839SVZ8_9PROT|nr:YaaC family protein [Limibacillus halophilus]MBB3066662.1 hypothetical protein [Limibacillus halophilus]
MKGKQIKLGNRRVWMHKAIQHTNFEAESVLSNDPWLFVELWLKRNGKADALAYWLQARRFADATKTLGIEAAPLTLYYSFLNATKALLEVRSAVHGTTHGVTGERPASAKASLANEKVTFLSGGVLPALCRYLGESPNKHEYSLKELLWNLPFVHRAFRHTFTSAPELFIPLEKACYVSHDGTSEAWFEAMVIPRYADGRILQSIPGLFETFEHAGNTFVRREKRFKWIKGRSDKREKSQALVRLGNYHSTTRRIVVPISGNRDLWYLKKNSTQNKLAERHELSIAFAAMHRLSELSRYDPRGFDRHLCGNANWLLTEFIEHAASQFIDQISSEITGFQFWKPGIRS